MFRDKIKLLMKNNINNENKQSNKKEENKKERKLENLILLVVILIILTIAINAIWLDEDEEETSTNKQLVELEIEPVTEILSTKKELEVELENILSKIAGVGDATVFVNYTSSSQTIPMYDENVSLSSTTETDTEGASRIISEEEMKKEIVFGEEAGEKKLLVEQVVSAKIEGAIVTAQGAGNAEVRSKIIQAVEAVTGLATHKIQVFEEK